MTTDKYPLPSTWEECADPEAVALPRWPAFGNARELEAHLLDAHQQDLIGVPREIKTLEWLRVLHTTMHARGHSLFLHGHDSIDLPESEWKDKP